MTRHAEQRGAYATTTGEITVTVEPTYLDDQSAPDENRYVWAYHVRIKNEGADTVQLLTRHWRITDARGQTQEVRGDGVVGEQPVLAPGESFEYTSGTPLPTASGFMVGSYGMKASDGHRFDVDVPAFSLDCPFHQGAIN